MHIKNKLPSATFPVTICWWWHMRTEESFLWLTLDGPISFKAMWTSLITPVPLMMWQQWMIQTPTSLLRSKKLRLSLGSIWLLTLVRDAYRTIKYDLSILAAPQEKISFGLLAKSHSWYFCSWVWIRFASHVHGQNHWPTKPAMNEYHSFKLFWVNLCFSLFLWSWIKHMDVSPGMLVCIHILEKNISSYSVFFTLFYKSLKEVAIHVFGWDEVEQSQHQ